MNEQRRYDIRDAARLLGVAPSTLRYWEDQGIIRAERDPASRYRKYGLSALVDASEIVLFRSMGVPVCLDDLGLSGTPDELDRLHRAIAADFTDFTAEESRRLRSEMERIIRI